jgi:hypothetical protein
MIYFLKADLKIKIGFTDDPPKRISSIQVSSPFPLEVMLIIDGNYEKERELHSIFKEFRTSGEWFDLAEPITNFIDQNLRYDRRYEFGFIKDDFMGNEQILRLRLKHNLTLRELGEKLNITGQSVKEIQDRERTGGLTINVFKNVAESLGYVFEYRFTRKIE